MKYNSFINGFIDICIINYLVLYFYVVKANDDCNAHIDATCLPGHIISPFPCQKTDDCQIFNTVNVKSECINNRCRSQLICPLGFLSWENGCLPYASANQKCPAGSEQCIQGLLCVDGKCLGACGEDELLVNGKCVYHGEPDCIVTNCEEDGCPTNHPICTLQENIYQCCKPKSSRRANRHIDDKTSAEVFDEQIAAQKRPPKRRKPRILPATITKFNIAKPRKRILPSAPTNIYIYKPAPRSTSNFRSINTVNTATISPFLATLTIPTPRTLSLISCISYAEVQIGNQCYPRVAAGQGCTFTAQCPSTTTAAVSTPYRCINNICQLNIVCTAGYFRFNNACLKYSATGQSCAATTTQCISGSTCINGTCYSGCATNQLQLDGVCVGYADYGCILRSCESDTCPTNFPVCNYLRSQNAYVCCTASLTNALVCANGELPQLSFGTNLPIDCIARSCARGYSCTHSIIDGTSRYICCPRTTISVTTTTAAPVYGNPLNGFLSVCMKQSMRPGCHQVSQQLCFCSYPTTTTSYEIPLATFTTAIPNSTTTLTSTTTTTTTTTAAPTVLCQTCTLADVNLVQGTLPGENPNAPAGIQIVNGCNQLTVVCATGNAAINAVMEFNGFIGGPSDSNNTPFVSAALRCVNGNWVYSEPGTAEVIINQIQCFSSVDPGITTTTTTTLAPTDCNSCVFPPPSLDPGADITPTSNGIVVDANGCQQLTVVCDGTGIPNAEAVFMQFNDQVGGPSSTDDGNLAPDAQLSCNAGAWFYSADGATLEVDSVQCLLQTVP